jgi:hypothetical protein
MTIKNLRLFPHVAGQPHLVAQGDYALFYKHPDDLYLTPVFDEVSQEFIHDYLKTRTWCQDAREMGWEFICLPSSATLGLEEERGRQADITELRRMMEL